jgi:hypothetical protein
VAVCGDVVPGQAVEAEADQGSGHRLGSRGARPTAPAAATLDESEPLRIDTGADSRDVVASSDACGQAAERDTRGRVRGSCTAALGGGVRASARSLGVAARWSSAMKPDPAPRARRRRRLGAMTALPLLFAVTEEGSDQSSEEDSESEKDSISWGAQLDGPAATGEEGAHGVAKGESDLAARSRAAFAAAARGGRLGSSGWTLLSRRTPWDERLEWLRGGGRRWPPAVWLVDAGAQRSCSDHKTARNSS